MTSFARALPAVLAATAVLCLAGAASADPKPHVVTLAPVIVTGHAKTPLASIEVSKATATLPLAELRQPLAARIELTVHSSAL